MRIMANQRIRTLFIRMGICVGIFASFSLACMAFAPKYAAIYIFSGSLCMAAALLAACAFRLSGRAGGKGDFPGGRCGCPSCLRPGMDAGGAGQSCEKRSGSYKTGRCRLDQMETVSDGGSDCDQGQRVRHSPGRLVSYFQEVLPEPLFEKCPGHWAWPAAGQGYCRDARRLH